MTDKDKALKKLKIEINKNIDSATTMAKSGGLLEFLYFIYQLRLTRIFHTLSKDSENAEIQNIYTDTTEESLKYVIPLIAKYGHGELLISDDAKRTALNEDIIKNLIPFVTLVNSKYETESLIKLFDVQVFGERNQKLKIDMSNIKTDTDARSLFNYFLRIDEDNSAKKRSKKNKDSLIQSFKEEYLPVSELFEKEIGISVDEFCMLIDQLLKKVTDKIRLKEKLFEKLPNGNVNVESYITFLHFIQCFLEDKEALLNSFEKKFHTVIERLTFKPSSFNERELRFHQVTRQPLFQFDTLFVISPELILDSLFTNIHYSLTEAPGKQNYMAKKASTFLDKIANIAFKFGYIEVGREIDLFEGKNQIGDIDIMFKNSEGHFLLIEAKNHMLPMDIYFKDVEKTKEQLTYQQNEWVKKVARRFDHLKSNYTSYGIPEDHLYMVVSRFPEVISHYSDLLILSLEEFEIWLEKFKNITSFTQFYDYHYEADNRKMTREEMNELQNANIIFGRFEKK